ncbi:hypothetical protein D3C76_1333980 [compost metagenome]
MDERNTLARHHNRRSQTMHFTARFVTLVRSGDHDLIPQCMVVMTLYIIYALNWLIGKLGDIPTILDPSNNPALDVILEVVAPANKALFIINKNVAFNSITIPVVKMSDPRKLISIVLISTNRLWQYSVHDPSLANCHK